MIENFMGQDHDRLDAIFVDFRKAADVKMARELFSQFETGLKAHICWEEEILFPSFEEKTGMKDTGPTAVMRLEHGQIKKLLTDIRESIGSARVGALAEDLIEILSSHNQKEEQILYPWFDETLAPWEKAALLDRIKGSPTGVPV